MRDFMNLQIRRGLNNGRHSRRIVKRAFRYTRKHGTIVHGYRKSAMSQHRSNDVDSNSVVICYVLYIPAGFSRRLYIFLLVSFMVLTLLSTE
jgi:hypothetical protein